MTHIRSRPIATRIFQIVLFGNLLSVVAMLVFAWWSLEQLESTAIEADRRIELDYFEHYGDKDKPHRIQSSQLISVFQPKHMRSTESLPIVFQNLPVPFQGEVTSINKEYSVIAHEFPEGTFYMAKDLRLFEEQEEIFVTSILSLAIIILIAMLGLAFYASRKISDPIMQFTKTIASLRPDKSIAYIDKNFSDSELNQIADAVNGLIRQIDENIERERKFIAMASHELRTPIAIVLGAANVLEKRQQLNPEDNKTLQRIIHASREMSENIQALLTLARSNKTLLSRTLFDINEIPQELYNSYTHENAANRERLQLVLYPSPVMINTDKALARILIHNLVSNALQHTAHKVRVTVHPEYIEVLDEGITTAITHFSAGDDYLASGLGLYIVRLACDPLGWQYQLHKQDGGSCIQLKFGTA